MQGIDAILNKITMYRLVVYVLGFLVMLSVALAWLGKLSFSPTALVVSLFLVLVSAYLTDRVMARFLRVPTNMESALITSLIIFLIVQPASSLAGGLALVLAGAVSSASKFLLAHHGKHLFNPAAFAAGLLSLTGLQATTWWIGSTVFWPFTLVLGLAVVRKIRRGSLFIVFAVVSIVLQYLLLVHAHQAVMLGMKHALLASPLIFLGSIMLTEPATMPSRRNLQVVFAALVAVLYVTGWAVGPFVVYPEIALLLGNIFAYAVSPKFKVRLQLKEIQKISDHVFNYVLQPEHRFNFKPGQYMEWTLAGVPYDSRGNRRTFTIASSPTEEDVQLGVKYYQPASTYKSVFYDMQAGDVLYASHLAGNFTLPAKAQKLAFIAGGIGITPFRSMIKYLTDKNIMSDIVLIYLVSDPQEFAYVAELKAARAVGIKTIPVVTDLSYQAPDVVTAKLSIETLARLVPDSAERTFYISGPNTMVDGTKADLRRLGISRRHIRTDHFSGY